MNTAVAATPQRSVSLLLFIGILLVPIIFAWFLLRNGHTTLARILGFGWLVFFLVSFWGGDTPTTVASVSATATTSPVPKEPVSRVSGDTKAVEQIEQRFSDNQKSLKNYYSTPEKVKQANMDILQLTMAKVTYGENGKSKEEKALGQKAAALLPKVEQQAREMYASSLEEAFVKTGMDVDVTTYGKGKKQLRISYALMSQPLVYKLQNEINVSAQASAQGFTKLVYTNGFESSLGKTWTIDLSGS